jgi:methylated-DNA-[protein]-cysteine S-methyltransferase
LSWLTTAADFQASLEVRLHGSVVAIETDRDDRATELLARGSGAARAVLAGEEPGRVPIDLHDRPDWDRTVLAAVREIRLGTTASYGEIARRIGRPGAARAVGGAVGRNPITLLIPCHRVIAGDGSLGGYGGDAWGSREERLDIKRDLLQLEGVTIGRDRP